MPGITERDAGFPVPLRPDPQLQFRTVRPRYDFRLPPQRDGDDAGVGRLRAPVRRPGSHLVVGVDELPYRDLPRAAAHPQVSHVARDVLRIRPGHGIERVRGVVVAAVVIGIRDRDREIGRDGASARRVVDRDGGLPVAHRPDPYVQVLPTGRNRFPASRQPDGDDAGVGRPRTPVRRVRLHFVVGAPDELPYRNPPGSAARRQAVRVVIRDALPIGGGDRLRLGRFAGLGNPGRQREQEGDQETPPPGEPRFRHGSSLPESCARRDAGSVAPAPPDVVDGCALERRQASISVKGAAGETIGGTAVRGGPRPAVGLL